MFYMVLAENNLHFMQAHRADKTTDTMNKKALIKGGCVKSGTSMVTLLDNLFITNDGNEINIFIVRKIL